MRQVVSADKTCPCPLSEEDLEKPQRCGLLLIWPDRDMVRVAPKPGANGRPALFSAEDDHKTVRATVFLTTACQFGLMVKLLFGLPFRQIKPRSATGSGPPGAAAG